MEPFVRRFIKSSLAWLGIGVLIGIAMAIVPMRAIVLRPAHAHANLLGFVSMMIFGVAYHVIPRFSGHALHHRRLASAHLLLANLGLALMVGGWVLRAASVALPLVPVGALVNAAGAAAFIYNIWRTIDGATLTSALESPLVTMGARPGGNIR
jgi:cbb3-type cytochrome oxidase subunit 1